MFAIIVNNKCDFLIHTNKSLDKHDIYLYSIAKYIDIVGFYQNHNSVSLDDICAIKIFFDKQKK